MEEEKKSDDSASISISMEEQVVLPVDIENLTFSYDMHKEPNIVGLNCKIEPNSKVILVGANGTVT
eukprot:scaffold63326_cov72-Cyclotella_meneghiniana.AAC.11